MRNVPLRHVLRYVHPQSLFPLLLASGVAAGGCAKGPSSTVDDFASSVIVRGTVRDTLGSPVHDVPVATVAFSSADCSGYHWSNDSTATDSLGRYSCRLSNMGRPQSVSATASPSAGLGLAPGTSCRADLHLEAPSWRDTLTVDFVLRGS